MRLRDVELTDVGAYVRMRCDPVMMAGLGGPLPREGIEAKVQRDVGQAAAGRSLGFTLTEERDIAFNDRILRANHWIIDPGAAEQAAIDAGEITAGCLRYAGPG